MSRVQDYFRSLQKSIQDEFQRIREQISDRDAKGHANELGVSRLLAKYIPEVNLRHNVEIIDDQGHTSGEMDVCACNRFQLSRADEGPLLAQGVDFVVQVKARLTNDELKRIQQNAGLLKSLRRLIGPGDEYFVHHESATPHVISRIPYFVLAYESALRMDTALSQWQSILVNGKVPSHLQPEAIFVLNRGALLRVNIEDGSIPSPTSEEHFPAWHTAEFECGTLLAFISTLLQFGRGIRHIQNPLGAYLRGSGLLGTTVEKRYGISTVGSLLTPAIWNQLLAVYNVLVTSICENDTVKMECDRRFALTKASVEGDFPADAFQVNRSDGMPIVVDDQLLTEIRLFLRHMTGKDPAISPYPKVGVPFGFESRTINAAIEVAFDDAFIADLQRWAEVNCVLFRRTQTE